MPKGFGIDPLFAAIIATLTPGKTNENLLGHYVSTPGHGSDSDCSKKRDQQELRARRKRQRQAKKKGRR